MSRARLIAGYAAWAGFALFLVAVWAAPMRAVFRVGIVARRRWSRSCRPP